jgi:hypothetical protein
VPPPSPGDRNRSSLQNVFFVFIEYQMMGKVQKQRNLENYKLLSSPFVKLGKIIKIAFCYTRVG